MSKVKCAITNVIDPEKFIKTLNQNYQGPDGFHERYGGNCCLMISRLSNFVDTNVQVVGATISRGEQHQSFLTDESNKTEFKVALYHLAHQRALRVLNVPCLGMRSVATLGCLCDDG